MPAVVVKKEEKVAAVFAALGDSVSESSFIETFKEMYPKDWDRIKAKFRQEEAHSKPGKSHPMPEPDVYMKNMYKTAMAKRGK